MMLGKGGLQGRLLSSLPLQRPHNLLPVYARQPDVEPGHVRLALLPENRSRRIRRVLDQKDVQSRSTNLLMHRWA